MSSKAGIIALTLCAAAFHATGAEGMSVVKTSVTGEFRYDSSADPGSIDSGEDYISVLAPELELINEWRNARLDVLYRLTGSYYLKDSARNYLSHQAGAGADIQLSENTTLQASYNFRFTEESREATLTNIQTSRAGIHSHLATFNATHVLTPNTSISFSVSENLLEFEDPELVDTRTDTGAVTVNYRISDNTTISPAYSFTNMVFDTNRSIQSHNASAGMSYRYSPTIDLNASVGLIYYGTGDGGTDLQSGAGFVKTFPKGALSASYARSTSNSSGLTDQLNINDTLSAGLSHALTHRLSLGLSTSYSINRTRQEGTVDIHSYQAGVSANWQAKSWLAVGAGYSYFKQDSRGTSGIDAERNVLSVNFVLQPYEYRN